MRSSIEAACCASFVVVAHICKYVGSLVCSPSGELTHGVLAFITRVQDARRIQVRDSAVAASCALSAGNHDTALSVKNMTMCTLRYARGLRDEVDEAS